MNQGRNVALQSSITEIKQTPQSSRHQLTGQQEFNTSSETSPHPSKKTFYAKTIYINRDLKIFQTSRNQLIGQQYFKTSSETSRLQPSISTGIKQISQTSWNQLIGQQYFNTSPEMSKLQPSTSTGIKQISQHYLI